MSEKLIKSELHTKSTASLKAEVEKELEVEDPDKDKVEAILSAQEWLSKYGEPRTEG